MSLAASPQSMNASPRIRSATVCSRVCSRAWALPGPGAGAGLGLNSPEPENPEAEEFEPRKLEAAKPEPAEPAEMSEPS